VSRPWKAVTPDSNGEGWLKYSRVARSGLFALCILVAAYTAAFAVRIYARKYYFFVPDYVRWQFSTSPSIAGPIHVFLVFADHFEPAYDAARTRTWAARFAQLAARHHDGDGRPPRHTWFYPGEQPDPAIMRTLLDLTSAGLGEVELHYHHAFDTSETLRPRMLQAIRDFQRYGFLETIDRKTRFAFIHGNFGLDNSNGAEICGVNDELKLLRELGCFGDYSFPSLYQDSQPSVVNSIYAARDDSGPKSYDTRWPLSALANGRADLMIFEGPLIFRPALSLRRLFLDLEDGNIHPAKPATPARANSWVRAAVHVPQRPDWIFIKLFAHGISSADDEDVVLGEGYDKTLTYLEQTYNDGRRYRLHYITAREAYNLAMAAAGGAKGDPTRHLNSTILPYIADGHAEPAVHVPGQPN
jgi:hypothetical protein